MPEEKEKKDAEEPEPHDGVLGLPVLWEPRSVRQVLAQLFERALLPEGEETPPFRISGIGQAVNNVVRMASTLDREGVATWTGARTTFLDNSRPRLELALLPAKGLAQAPLPRLALPPSEKLVFQP